MAIHRNSSLSGIVGPVVVYKLNGKDVMRARPRSFKQTRATKTASKQFGQASMMSARFMRQLQASLEGIDQAPMRLRFQRVLQDWLRSGKPPFNTGASAFSPVQQFQFNEKVSLSETMRVLPSVDWSGKTIILNIPGIIPSRDIAAPPNTSRVHLVIEGTSISLRNGGSRGYPRVERDIVYNDDVLKAQQFTLDITPMEGELVLVILAIKYTMLKPTQERFLADERWLPAGVVGCYYKEES